MQDDQTGEHFDHETMATLRNEVVYLEMPVPPVKAEIPSGKWEEMGTESN
jgi:hypothetical protein